jgi:hypothetical protein
MWDEISRQVDSSQAPQLINPFRAPHVSMFGREQASGDLFNRVFTVTQQDSVKKLRYRFRVKGKRAPADDDGVVS